MAVEKPTDRALVFGGLPQDYLNEWQISSDTALMRQKLRVEIEVVPAGELLGRMGGLDDGELADAAFLAEELLEHTEGGGIYEMPSEEAVAQAVRFYVAMRSLFRERDADALTVNCGAVKGEGSPVPCVALTLFLEDGVPAACQADMDAFLTMILFRRAGAMPAFLGGSERRDAGVRIGHCVMPRNMSAPDGPPAPYRLARYHGGPDSPTIETEAPVERQVTVARLTKDAERLLLTTGRIVSNLHETPYCPNAVLLELEDADAFMEHITGGQYHLVMACGDHAAAMREMAEAAGAEVLP